MISGQLHVFRSPQARTASASLPRGTKSIVCIRVEFLPAAFASFDGYGVPPHLQTSPKQAYLDLRVEATWYLFFWTLKRFPHTLRRVWGLDWVEARMARAPRRAWTPSRPSPADPTTWSAGASQEPQNDEIRPQRARTDDGEQKKARVSTPATPCGRPRVALGSVGPFFVDRILVLWHARPVGCPEVAARRGTPSSAPRPVARHPGRSGRLRVVPYAPPITVLS